MLGRVKIVAGDSTILWPILLIMETSCLQGPVISIKVQVNFLHVTLPLLQSQVRSKSLQITGLLEFTITI